MGYQERFVDACTQDGWDAALELVTTMFHKAVSVDDDEGPAAKRFAKLVKGFEPKATIVGRVKWILECLDEDRAKEELRHVFSPFDTLAFEVRRDRVVARSLHGEEVSRFGLHHELAKSREDYELASAVTRDCYRFELDGEVVPGEVVYRDATFVLFARWLVKLVAKLMSNAAFARFPKVLPFRFVVIAAERTPPIRLALVPPVTEVSLPATSRKLWLEASELRGDTGVDARFLFLLPSLRELASRDRDALIALVQEHAHLRAIVVEIANEELREANASVGRPEPEGDELLARARRLVRKAQWDDRYVSTSVVTFARLLRACHDPDATAYEAHVLRLPLPSLPEDRDRCYHVVEQAIALRFAVWSTVPEAARPAVIDAWTAARAAMRDAATVEPLIAIILAEHEAPPISESKPPDQPRWLAAELADVSPHIRTLAAAPPPSYIDAVIAAVRRMGPPDGSGGGIWDFLRMRIFALGPRAASAIPDVLAWGERWCMRTPGVYFDDKLPRAFGQMLMVMGLRDIPEFVKRAQREQAWMFDDFYPQWAAGST